jgi:uncharacterized protein with von Willebrand factor type A (vWA) domain
MESTVTGFVQVLRNAEVRVSPAETLDAMRALELVGYSDREKVRQVLAATLAKTVEEKQVFDECFTRFFAWNPPPREQPPQPGPQERETGPAGAEQHAQGADGAPAPAPPAGALSELSELLMSADSPRLQLAIDAAGRAAGIGGMRVFTQRGLYTRRVLETLGWQDLQRDILLLEQQAEGSRPGRNEGLALKRHSEMLRDRVRDYVEQQYLMFASHEMQELRESVLRSARLSNLEKRDLAQINRLVRRIARRLAARYSRRRRSFRRGLLDVPRTLRRASAHDGIAFEPRWKSVRKDRPALVAVCDVSGSVSAYSRFLLLFLYSLNDVLPRVRSFVFSSRLGEVTSLFEENAPEVAVEIAQRRWGGGSTDYAAAFRGLLEAAGRELDRGATVVFLGDGRNNYGDPALDALREIARRSRQLIWLNPESRSAWQSGDSEMERYRSCASEVRVCQSIADLERFADELLRKAW